MGGGGAKHGRSRGGGEDIRTKEEEYGWRAIQTDAGQRTDGWEVRDNRRTDADNRQTDWRPGITDGQMQKNKQTDRRAWIIDILYRRGTTDRQIVGQG